ncbi:uncharacterized protein PHALS_13651 [Plasmopara halstedii]|uniref:Uncharacterized protein n=1 Tax=Plasmopara halstedii TaxID=4781 RepID=A0A0P1AQ61_PLAHL|nr:uncharacterized protein PHALS_13651 [Plasmopara halstedii]CEG43456.1 hypothetical protein PHALS_13651 [Plasmopara halstedii]|eukprot:XP_024579825.1 hypothetical protein PHALS_13651 [Plasmopara halstedii]
MAPESSVVSCTGERKSTTAQGHSCSSAHGRPASRDTTEKRGAQDDANRHDPSGHKRLRRLGSFAEVTPQPPTSSRSLSSPTTSQDMGLNPVDNNDQQGVLRGSERHHFHQEELKADDDDVVDRRPVIRDALSALEDKVRRHRHSAEHLSEVAYRCAEDLESLEYFAHRLPCVEIYRALSERLLVVKKKNTSL